MEKMLNELKEVIKLNPKNSISKVLAYENVVEILKRYGVVEEDDIK